MSLKDNIIDKVIKPQTDSKFDNLIARVTSYDKDSNTASIMFKNPKNVGVMDLDDVPVFLHKGIKTPSLKSGDNVYVMFVNGSIMQPHITGVVERSFLLDTRIKQRHRRKGAYIVDNEYEDVEIKRYKDQSSVSNWITKEPVVPGRFLIQSTSDPISELINDIATVGFFGDEEVGLYHPTLSSIVKLRDNGCIDIFTSSNQGIRINPETKSIKFLSENLNFSNNQWYIESNSFVFKGKEFTIESDDINLNAKKLNMKYEEINN